MSASKERPILFTAPVVRAILSGQKTVTRRVVKPQYCEGPWFVKPALESRHAGHSHDWWLPTGSQPYAALPKCPYGRPGDRLWVREAWQADAQVNAISPRELSHGEPIQYPADGASRQTGCSMITPGRTRPSIHMPRWACRILLEITAVRVERLRESSDLDLLDEICDMLEDCDSTAGREFSRIEHLQSAGAPLRMLPEMYGFAAFWDEKHGHGSFESNPWVWVVEFKRVTP